MTDVMVPQSRHGDPLGSLLTGLLSTGLELTGTVLGNVQLMNWRTRELTIVAQHGFTEDFVNFFRVVKASEGTACARALSARHSVIVEDVLVDPAFAPFRQVALESGFRAVQSTPLISSSGAFLGVLSTHFPGQHRPTENEMRALSRVAELAANAIIRHRAQARANGPARENGDDKQIASSLAAMARSYHALDRADRLLQRFGNDRSRR